MDSVTQLALGAAVGVATMGRRAPVWRAALWGGICGTLPDLDVFIDHGDPIRSMTLHRTETHALFYLTLAAPAIAGLIAAIQRDGLFRRWWLAVWLALVTHPLLDLMTVYGTQLGLPFTDHPFAVGSIFIIDPLYTLPLLVGLVGALAATRSRAAGALRWNAAGLALSTAYLGWSVVAQQHVRAKAEASLERAGIATARVLVTPAPFNTVLWRVVAMTPDGWLEGLHSLLDEPGDIRFVRRPTDVALAGRFAADWHLQRVAWFSRGFYDVAASPDGLRLRDLRMGLGDHYTFTFVLPSLRDDVATAPPLPPRQVPLHVDLPRTLGWLWRRVQGQPLPPP